MDSRADLLGGLHPQQICTFVEMVERYLWIFGLVLVVGAVLLWTFISRRRRLKRFADRDDLSLDTIYSRFFAAKNLPKGLVFELWNEIAIPLRVPPGQLRPSDRFDLQLVPVEGWEFDDDSLEINWASSRRLKRLGVEPDLSQVQTLGDYVEFFCKLEIAKDSASDGQ